MAGQPRRQARLPAVLLAPVHGGRRPDDGVLVDHRLLARSVPVRARHRALPLRRGRGRRVRRLAHVCVGDQPRAVSRRVRLHGAVRRDSRHPGRAGHRRGAARPVGLDLCHQRGTGGAAGAARARYRPVSGLRGHPRQPRRRGRHRPSAAQRLPRGGRHGGGRPLVRRGGRRGARAVRVGARALPRVQVPAARLRAFAGGPAGVWHQRRVLLLRRLLQERGRGRRDWLPRRCRREHRGHGAGRGGGGVPRPPRAPPRLHGRNDVLRRGAHGGARDAAVRRHGRGPRHLLNRLRRLLRALLRAGPRPHPLDDRRRDLPRATPRHGNVGGRGRQLDLHLRRRAELPGHAEGPHRIQLRPLRRLPGRAAHLLRPLPPRDKGPPARGCPRRHGHRRSPGPRPGRGRVAHQATRVR
mmetsp:Transcript_16366/g.62102  ORF Transcript_16366/g.62102 Transcript_16366/m.62102 type:complete len:411 (-) Transcript_16366:359-1591(-)